MTIKILPPQLANQIAAGEVVERPASVVKELVENALDAGGNKIDIEIEKGGHKRILVRDNGKGISKEQLTLALSRHATSKISDIEDLEAIVSLGFRGEALASISSVARLTMTSKPAEQNEAWSAIAEGLDMDVTVKPAAHPNGTSVDVVDLFFNTPARRKFLRAEKTEFSHIDTLIKRIALSRPDVTFVLKHNGKLVKRYRGLANESDQIKQVSHRVSEVINPKFVEQSSVHSVNYDQVSIRAWVKRPDLCVSVNPAQYAFVNGRMMRDKLIQHAIRQAFADNLHPEQQPEYVVFVDLPAQDVDVNVHPAKHEVRFHYARLLHDLVVRTIQEAIDSFSKAILADSDQAPPAPDWLVTPQQNVSTVAPSTQRTVTASSNNQSTGSQRTLSQSISTEIAATQIEKSALKPKFEMQETPVNRFPSLKPATKRDRFGREQVSNSQLDAFAQYASTAKQAGSMAAEEISTSSPSFESETEKQECSGISDTPLQLVMLQQQRYAFIRGQDKLYLLDLNRLASTATQEVERPELWQRAPLLVPIRLKLSTDELDWCLGVEALFSAAGFEIKLHRPYLIVKQVPNILRRGNASLALPEKLSALMLTPNLTLEQLKHGLSSNSTTIWNEQQLQLLLQDPAQSKQLKAHFQELIPEQLL